MINGFNQSDKVNNKPELHKAATAVAAELGYPDICVDRVVQWKQYRGAQQEFEQFMGAKASNNVAAGYCIQHKPNSKEETWTILIGPNDQTMEWEDTNYIAIHSLAHELGHALIATCRRNQGLTTRNLGLANRSGLIWKAEEGAAEVLAAQLMPQLIQELGWGRDQLGEWYYQIVTRDTAPAYKPYRMAMNIILGLVGNHWDNNDLYKPELFPVPIKEVSVLGIVDLLGSAHPLEALAGSISYMHDITRSDARALINNMLHKSDKFYQEASNDREAWNKMTAMVKKSGIVLWDEDEHWEDMLASILADQNLAA